jgi:hypothetical protein
MADRLSRRLVNEEKEEKKEEEEDINDFIDVELDFLRVALLLKET